MSAGDVETQEEFAKMIGTCTKRRHSTSVSLDEGQTLRGYTEQVSETNEFRIPPAKLVMADDVKLVYPGPHGWFCRLRKIKPGTKLIPATPIPWEPSVTEPLPSIGSPMSPWNDPYQNWDARVLSLEEMNKAARAALVKHGRVTPQGHSLEQPKQSLQQKIGEIVSSYLPVVKDQEDVVECEDSITIKELEGIAARLASDPELLKNLREDAGK